jgi:diguanylate cyclase
LPNPSGKVEVAANNLLEGADVSARPWFIHGVNQVYLGDVHKAVLLAKKLKRLILMNHYVLLILLRQFMIHRPKIKGVLAAHADWSWASMFKNSFVRKCC